VKPVGKAKSLTVDYVRIYCTGNYTETDSANRNSAFYRRLAILVSFCIACRDVSMSKYSSRTKKPFKKPINCTKSVVPPLFLSFYQLCGKCLELFVILLILHFSKVLSVLHAAKADITPFLLYDMISASYVKLTHCGLYYFYLGRMTCVISASLFV